MNKTEEIKLPEIIAVDFDGTLCTDKWPNIGEPNANLFGDIFSYKIINPEVKVILWTCRTGELLEEAVNWCKGRGLEFDAVNDNIPEVKEKFGGNARKIYANVYLDDKAVTIKC